MTDSEYKNLEIKTAVLLSELVQCPSVNPGGGCAAEAGSVYGEKAYAELLAEKVEALGGKAELTEANAGRVNFVGRFKGTQDSTRSITFESHADTVSHLGMTIDPFGGEITGGKVFGRGSCDTKAAMAAFLTAIELTLEAGGPACDINIVSTFDEEITGTGVRKLMADGFTTDAVIIGEPTSLDVIHAAKGSMRYFVSVFGKAAHSSTPGEGENAIVHMSSIINAINKFSKTLSTRKDEILGRATICMGVINGGSQVNIVPDKCTLDIDRRLIPQENLSEAILEIERLLKDTSAANGNFKYTVKSELAYPPFSQDADSDLVKSVHEAAAEFEPSSSLSVVSWAATSGVFAQHGIPAVILGPGNIAQAHTTDEFVEIDQLVKATKIYSRIMSQYIPEKN